MNSSLFPLPFGVHILFCIISLLFFVYQYYRKRYAYQLLLAFAIPSTLLIYFFNHGISYVIFGVEQLFLLVVIIVAISTNKRRLTKEAAVVEYQSSLEKKAEVVRENKNDFDADKFLNDTFDDENKGEK